MSVKDIIAFDWVGVSDVKDSITILVEAWNDGELTYKDGTTKYSYWVIGKEKGKRDSVRIKINNDSFKWMLSNGIDTINELVERSVTFSKVLASESASKYDMLVISEVK